MDQQGRVGTPQPWEDSWEAGGWTQLFMVSYWPATLGPTWGPLEKPAGAEDELGNRPRDQTSILHRL